MLPFLQQATTCFIAAVACICHFKSWLFQSQFFDHNHLTNNHLGDAYAYYALSFLKPYRIFSAMYISENYRYSLTERLAGEYIPDKRTDASRIN